MNNPDTIYRMTADDLFTRIEKIADSLPAEGLAPSHFNRQIHETLVLCCQEGIRNTRHAFGNLFTQTTFLCRHHRLSSADAAAVQRMRYHSNHSEQLDRMELLYDLAALARFVSAVFNQPVPGTLTAKLPQDRRKTAKKRGPYKKKVRCIVQEWEGTDVTVTTEDWRDGEPVAVDCSAAHLAHMLPLLRKGMQLNLLDCTEDDQHRLVPSLIILEPDFLINISTLAGCFEQYGHHPLNYTLKRMAPAANTQAILLGNMAGQLLDDAVNDSCDSLESLKKNFRRKALEYCTCPDFNGHDFKSLMAAQAVNIRQAVDVLYPRQADGSSDRSKAVLEPSFVCESLGLQGRVDLMNTDFSLLVEQKSGKNFNIENQRAGAHGNMMLEPHYVQLLLYYGILRRNFNLGPNCIDDLHLLYSRYPADKGLVAVNYYQELFREAIRLRNEIVAIELDIAEKGFEAVIDDLRPEIVNTNHLNTNFYQRYLLPPINKIVQPLHALDPLERAYFCRMMTFVYREQRVQELGIEEAFASAGSDPWNLPLDEKKAQGEIMTELQMENAERSDPQGGYDLITLHRKADETVAVEPNFRPGDAVYLYSYEKTDAPDLRKAFLFKATLMALSATEIKVALSDGQQNPDLLTRSSFAVEHAPAGNTTAAIRSLCAFAASDKEHRRLLLAQRTPRHDDTLRLSHPYHPDYDDVVLRAKQSRDYFLLVGPPGTGKTSMALQYLVKESLQEGQVLLTAYTNRAVDEICDMLIKAEIPFVRIGNEYRCDERFRNHMVSRIVGDNPRLDAMKKKLEQMPVVVGTSLTLLGQPSLFSLKHFAVAIVDEASQILEPDLVGLLVKVPRFILIGDHKQLPAVVQQSSGDSAVDDPMLHQIELRDCRNSLFERLYNVERSAGRSRFIGILQTQGRMHPDIAEFPCTTFYPDAGIRPVPLPHQQEPSSATHVTFISAVPKDLSPTSPMKSNELEASIVAQRLGQIYREHEKDFNPDETVGVIVPYRAQIALLRRRIEELGIEPLTRITIDTVERYQGSQRDIIFYSFTVTRPQQLRFLISTTFTDHDGRLIDRKLNVALTRARRQLIITGNPYLLRRNPLYASLLESIETHGVWIEEE